MIFVVALICFIGLVARLLFLLKDFAKFLYRKTFGSKFPRTFIDFGQYGVTFFTIGCISILGILFFKFSIALLAYILSDDLTSLFILMRGVFTAKTEFQNPLLTQNILSGLLLTPFLNFVTFYLMFRAIRTFMVGVNKRFNGTYSEGDMLYFGLVSVLVFTLIEIVFFTQRINGITGIAHLTFLSLDKMASICYFLTIAHIHLLKHEHYRASLPKYFELTRFESKILFTPWKTLVLTYLLGLILHAPFYSGLQFAENNFVVGTTLLIVFIASYFILRTFLSRGYDYIGVIMLAESPEYLSPSEKLFEQKTENKILIALGIMSFALLLIKPKLFLFIIIGLVVLGTLFLILQILSYLLGYGLAAIRGVASKIPTPSIKFLQLKKYIFCTVRYASKAASPMLAFVFFTWLLFSFFPKKFEFTNEDFVQSVFDKMGTPLFIEPSDGNSCIPITYPEIPDFLKRCLIIQEDRNFFEQNSWLPKKSNWHGISMAVFYRILSGGGGSNLNAQLIKNAAFPKVFPQDVSRKFAEIICSYQLSIQTTPEDIATSYFNLAGLNGGKGHSGLAMASLYTFGIPLNQLNSLEQMYLVATLKRGSGFLTQKGLVKYDDTNANSSEIKATLLKQAKSWCENNFITKREYSSLSIQELRFKNQQYKTVCATTTNELFKQEIRQSELVGIKYNTSITYDNQLKLKTAVKEFETRLSSYLKIGEYSLYSAALVVNVRTGEVIAHHGGKGITELTKFSEGNPIGSVIKPFVILQLLEDGFAADEIKLFDGKLNGRATPNNYSKHFSNRYVGIREILAPSLNAPMFNIDQLAEPISIFTKVENKFSSMSIKQDNSLQLENPLKKNEHKRNYPLGSRRMTIFDIAQSYQVLFNDGNFIKLHFLQSSYGINKKEMTKYAAPQSQLYSSTNTQTIRTALRQTMATGGTGSHIVGLLPQGKTYYAKTGTSDNSIHGYTVLCDGEILVVAWTSYGKIVNDHLELNATPSIPFESGVRSAGILSALIYSELQKGR